MRITYRRSDNREYWARRWAAVPADGAMDSIDSYPLKYAVATVTSKDGRILEAGCGAGRVLRYFHDLAYDIVGFDFIQEAVDKLKAVDSTLKVEVGDIQKLSYADRSFRYVLAFGLYHNLEHGLLEAVSETLRVLEPGGRVCASFRADNFQTRLSDWLKRGLVASDAQNRKFHKRNLTRNEFAELFETAGFVVESVAPGENMPLFYKFRFFRASSHKTFDESRGRREGYKLSPFGGGLQRGLLSLFPYQFCNIYVLTARRPFDSSPPTTSARL